MTIPTFKTAAAAIALLISLAIAVPAQARGGGGYAGNSGGYIVGGGGGWHAGAGGSQGGGFYGPATPDHGAFHAFAPQRYHGSFGGSCLAAEYDQWRRPITPLFGC